MRRHRWKHVGARIPVAISARDLGAQVSFGRRACAGVLKVRMTKGCRVARHIQSLPCHSRRKLQLLKGKASPMA
eukprot:8526047-Alexandrium_andersonii.AAC.1